MKSETKGKTVYGYGCLSMVYVIFVRGIMHWEILNFLAKKINFSGFLTVNVMAIVLCM